MTDAPRYNPNRTSIAEIFHGVMMFICAILLLVGLGANGTFWSLLLIGVRAEADVVRIEERVDVWMGNGGKNIIPKVETGVFYQFVLGDGQLQNGDVWFRGQPGDWTAGKSLPIMYYRSDARVSAPASLAYYWEHDSFWMTMLIITGIGLVGLVVCTRRKLALRSARRARERPSTSPGVPQDPTV